jgi:hypothetical protein
MRCYLYLYIFISYLIIYLLYFINQQIYSSISYLPKRKLRLAPVNIEKMTQTIMDPTNKPYFKIDLSKCFAGLTHQKSNLNTILLYCYHNNLKLIKPIFNLTGKHNNNKTLKTDLSKYYDLDGITINGEKFRLYDYDINNDKNTIKYKAKNYLVRFDSGFSNLVGNVNIPYQKDIINIAKQISLNLGDYMCIHVRRGDRITNKQIDIDTQPKNIMKVVNKYKPKSVYIMTNKINELRSLSNIKNIYFYTDFNFLESINDNYYLFCIENNIMEFAKIRCSTFNVKLNQKNANYYDCYLTNYHGWQ